MGDGLDELVTSTRFQEIHDARQNVIETQRAIAQAEVMGRISSDRATRIYRKMVENYIVELEDLIHTADETKLRTDYWSEAELGTMQLPDGNQRRITGLKSLLTIPEVIEVEYEKEVEKPRGGTSTEPVTEGVQLPGRIVRNAFRQCNHFCADIGLELEPKDNEDNVWHFREISNETAENADFDPVEGPQGESA